MTHPCKDCAKKGKENCPNIRVCDKYIDWVNDAWTEIQETFAEIAKRQ